jgi:PAS domain S-box-containing protein
MLENLNLEQTEAILETLPVDITFADAQGKILYWNKHTMRIFARPETARGGDVIKCHSEKSAARVAELLTDFAAGKKDRLEYRVSASGRTINVINIAVRDKYGRYLGVMEIDQDITPLQQQAGR